MILKMMMMNNMKYIKLFEDFKETDEYHFSNYFTKELDSSIKNWAYKNRHIITGVLGMGYGGIAYSLLNNKVLKYTEDDIEATAMSYLEGKNSEYLANVYEVNDFNGVWIIIEEKLKPLKSSGRLALMSLLDLYCNYKGIGTPHKYNFDILFVHGYDEIFANKLNKRLRKYYDNIFKIMEECKDNGFYVLDCKIENLGMKNNHVAMFDIKTTGYDISEEYKQKRD